MNGVKMIVFIIIINILTICSVILNIKQYKLRQEIKKNIKETEEYIIETNEYIRQLKILLGELDE